MPLLNLSSPPSLVLPHLSLLSSSVWLARKEIISTMFFSLVVVLFRLWQSSNPTSLRLHGLDELVDRRLSESGVSTLDVTGELPRSPSSVGVGQLERPEEVGGSLEVGSAGDNLMDETNQSKRVAEGQRVLRVASGD